MGRGEGTRSAQEMGTLSKTLDVLQKWELKRSLTSVGRRNSSPSSYWRHYFRVNGKVLMWVACSAVTKQAERHNSSTQRVLHLQYSYLTSNKKVQPGPIAQWICRISNMHKRNSPRLRRFRRYRGGTCRFLPNSGISAMHPRSCSSNSALSPIPDDISSWRTPKTQANRSQTCR